MYNLCNINKESYVIEKLGKIVGGRRNAYFGTVPEFAWEKRGQEDRECMHTEF